MKDHWRKPITKVCEFCKKDYFITSGKIKQRRYCTLACSTEGKKRTREILRLIPRPNETMLWRRYWYYRNHNITSSNDITDPADSYNFDYCDKVLYNTKYKVIW